MNNFNKFDKSFNDEPKVVYGIVRTIPVVQYPDEEPIVLYSEGATEHTFQCWDDEINSTIEEIVRSEEEYQFQHHPFAVTPHVCFAWYRYTDEVAPQHW